MDFIKSRDDLRQILEETFGGDHVAAMRFFEQLAKSKTWGGQECLIALARSFIRRVVDLLFDPNHHQGLPDKILDTDICLLFNGENHYDGLVRVAASAAEAATPWPAHHTHEKRKNDHFDALVDERQEELPSQKRKLHTREGTKRRHILCFKLRIGCTQTCGSMRKIQRGR